MSRCSDYLQAGLEGDLTTLRKLQFLCGFTVPEAAQFCGVAPETFRRWRTDRPPPVGAVRLLAIRAGAMPWPDWHGWEIHGGLLFAPWMDRGGFAPGDVLAAQYRYALIAEQARQIRELRDALAASEVQARAV